MKDPRSMTGKELRSEVIKNRCELRTTKDLNRKRALINRDHDLMTEMDSRRNNAK